VGQQATRLRLTALRLLTAGRQLASRLLLLLLCQAPQQDTWLWLTPLGQQLAPLLLRLRQQLTPLLLRLQQRTPGSSSTTRANRNEAGWGPHWQHRWLLLLLLLL
jgi:hypothetical protein